MRNSALLKLTRKIIHLLCTVYMSDGISDLRTAQPGMRRGLACLQTRPAACRGQHCDVRCLQAMAPCAACAPAGQPRCRHARAAGLDACAGIQAQGPAMQPALLSLE